MKTRQLMRSWILLFPVLSFLPTLRAWANNQQPYKSKRNVNSFIKLSAERSSCSSIIVVSPPGGVGEVAALKAAEMGNKVSWFVVSGNSDGANDVVLSQDVLDRIADAGGSIDLAGATANSLLSDESGSAVPAVSAWCKIADSLICSMDGVVDNRKRNDEEDATIPWRNAIKVASKEAASCAKGRKIVVLSASETDESMDDEQQGKGLGIGKLVSGLIGGNRVEIPASLTEAMGESNLIRLRHGQLFGTPESSSDFSPFIGGPRREPELCPEYSYATVRVDLTKAVSGGRMTGTRSSRHAVGEAAALLASGQIPVSGTEQLDVCVSSQPGTAKPTLEEWSTEFRRVENVMKAGESALLFEIEFSSVPDTDRLANWLASKWAPAVFRTYDIAAIRTGARPVSASRIASSSGGVEIIWQQLVNFESVTAGKMIIQVSDTGIKAIRGPGDPNAGFGSVSSKPLAGEDVLVRRLAEASSQAIEKGLALKLLPKTEKISTTSILPEPVVVSSIQSSGTISATPTDTSGPRQSGARRSTERERGTKRQKSSDEK